MDDPLLLQELADGLRGATDTPRRLLLQVVASTRMRHVRAGGAKDTNGVPFTPAFSVKTNPRPELLELAREHGFLAEVISGKEWLHARGAGFLATQIIYNGPRPLHREDIGERTFAAFADSVEAFAANAAGDVADVCGVRLRPKGIDSRFGVRDEELGDLVAAMGQMPAAQRFGLSFHVRTEDYGDRTWRDIVDLVAISGRRIQERSGKEVAVVDVGGGWLPEELDRLQEHEFEPAARSLREAFPALSTLIFEPGQSTTTAAEAVVCSVLEVRASRREAVVDLSFADVPQIAAHAHRLYWVTGGGLEPIRPGSGRILGSLCLEYDVVAPDVSLPESLRSGDRLVVADCGAYDSSMAFHFADGVISTATVP